MRPAPASEIDSDLLYRLGELPRICRTDDCGLAVICCFLARRDREPLWWLYRSAITCLLWADQLPLSRVRLLCCALTLDLHVCEEGHERVHPHGYDCAHLQRD